MFDAPDADVSKLSHQSSGGKIVAQNLTKSFDAAALKGKSSKKQVSFIVESNQE